MAKYRRFGWCVKSSGRGKSKKYGAYKPIKNGILRIEYYYSEITGEYTILVMKAIKRAGKYHAYHKTYSFTHKTTADKKFKTLLKNNCKIFPYY